MNLGDDFWLKLSLVGQKIIAEPAEKTKKSTKSYKDRLLKIKGSWFSKKEWLKTRKEVEKRLT